VTPAGARVAAGDGRLAGRQSKATGKNYDVTLARGVPK